MRVLPNGIEDKRMRTRTPTSSVLQNVMREDGCYRKSSSNASTDDEMAWHKAGPRMFPSSPELYQAINVIPTYLLDIVRARMFGQTCMAYHRYQSIVGTRSDLNRSIPIASFTEQHNHHPATQNPIVVAHDNAYRNLSLVSQQFFRWVSACMQSLDRHIS